VRIGELLKVASASPSTSFLPLPMVDAQTSIVVEGPILGLWTDQVINVNSACRTFFILQYISVGLCRPRLIYATIKSSTTN
jgi:hypothetical protein